MDVILKHEDFFCEFLDIKISKENIIDKVNAFDWLDLGECQNENDFAIIVNKFFDSFNFTYPKENESIIIKAFSKMFVDAINSIKESIEAVSKSYNIEGSKSPFRNEVVDKFYYIEYWATKKMIPVNYNERSQEKRELFNLDTIILSILADKLNAYNSYEVNKPKK